MQALVLTFKYYMPSNVVEASDDTPRSLDFGSYHMQNVSLDTTFTTDANTLYGFNLSLDSIKNAKNLETYSGFVNSKLTLPSGGGVTTIADNAFDGAISNYTNLGLPDNVITLDIPSTYLNIGESAFTSSDGLREIIFHRNPNYATNLGQHAFSELKSVSEIDFTDFNPGESGKLAAADGDKPFETIHLGRTEPGSDGLIYIPALCTQAQEQA
ncbi:MAG: leucine-rich repeat domain-containing protein [Mycoplasmoidaceae bacterium]|nr:leucine-rich repeat domain-containing protein [Mycoplasmoidaceae bacterium]